ncbi:hypothetical protein [Streptomyces hoynatensis]|uniref:Uncharacterized protein n=1 Tax=Streptomyces hoynatensis TaxID=1141874 RepID=A0A3A9Z4G6_9ACTN|nr:hypothetical protein [Streptomyces hoynatensis]RKN43110.1 hypothetical protein D7294_11500 [Streptomyces hoynatensis]
MREFVGTHEVLSDEDLVELALGMGTDPELWLGVEGESEQERAARLDAGADILADDPDLAAPVTTLALAAIETHALALAARWGGGPVVAR